MSVPFSKLQRAATLNPKSAINQMHLGRAYREDGDVAAGNQKPNQRDSWLRGVQPAVIAAVEWGGVTLRGAYPALPVDDIVPRSGAETARGGVSRSL